METHSVTIPQIIERLQKLSTERLWVAYDFVSYLAEKEMENTFLESDSAFQTMLATEAVLKRDWELAEEDEAWASL
ncbi:MAG: hypothetical protein HND44_14710 [Chloroflexi bacterium]|nr:hypothetical protein [Ardenticatenaceae bacterium]MBL1129715.1 hypothetical protein [Chloroflexota bacterium]NOG35796.1 hypothetical protein [Chloroflexota bacterium]GIK57892.1 MAG: hypothetical protein BroJett015_35550 [Chloroflexota bacterium]